MSTLNSRTASMPSISPLTPPGVTASWLDPVYSMPFSRKMFSIGRRPATENVLPLLVLVLALFKAVVDGAGIEGDQVIEAAAIERQILHLALAHHAGDRRGGGVDDGRLLGDRHLGDELADLELEVDARVLSDPEIDAGAVDGLESRLFDFDFLRSERQGKDRVTAGAIGLHDAGCAGFEARNGDGRAGDRAAGRVLHSPGDRGSDLCIECQSAEQ